MSKILVAEDNVPNRELMREILESRGHEVIEACDGQEALDKLEQTSPDLVLLDIQMPVLDGYAVLRSMRGNARFAALRVLAVTAFAMQGNREQVLAAGFDGYLSKPINISLLTKALQAFLEQETAKKLVPFTCTVSIRKV
jgi:CheY-like chemotaxis protein